MFKLVRVLLILSMTTGTLVPFLTLPASETQAYTMPGYNGKIFFQSLDEGNTEIISMNPDGSNRLNVTNSAGHDNEPSLSPDGTKISFSSNRNGNFDIYLMNVDGSGVTNLTNAVGADQNAMWSPNGQQLVFATGRDGNMEIYVMDADGSNQTRLTNTTGFDWDMDWSPDGSKIIFQSNRDGNAEIYSMNKDGSSQTRLTNSPGADYGPVFSPDGAKIAFTSNRDGSSEVYMMNVDGTGLANLTNTEDFDEEYSSFSSDGKSISYSRYNSAWTESMLVIHNIESDEAETYDLTAIGAVLIDAKAVWAPKGDSLIVSAYPADWSAMDLFKFNLIDKSVQKLTTIGSNNSVTWLSTSNTSPVTAKDTLAIPYEASGVADVLANDDDEEALDEQYLTIKTQPLNGTAAIMNGKVSYTPNDGFTGADQLTYQICDVFVLDQKCATGVLNITVLAPGAPSLSVSKVADSSYDIATNKYISATPRPTFSGTASSGAEIKVEIHSDTVILTTTADSSGKWSVAPTEDLPIGNHTVYISATLNGVTTELDSFVLAITGEASIPNTGASSWPLRVGGASLLLAGVGLAYWQRRRLQRCLPQLPDLMA